MTFGALTQQDTDGAIGTIESIVGAAMCGVVWAFTSGQPLIIISQTGPMLIFDKIIYQLSVSNNMDFLTYRFYSLFEMGILKNQPFSG